MWVLYSLLGLILLLIVLLSIPVYGRLIYDGELKVRIRVLGVPIVLMPRPEPKKKAGPAKSTSGAKMEKGKKPSKLKELAELLKQDDHDKADANRQNHTNQSHQAGEQEFREGVFMNCHHTDGQQVERIDQQYRLDAAHKRSA